MGSLFGQVIPTSCEAVAPSKAALDVPEEPRLPQMPPTVASALSVDTAPPPPKALGGWEATS